MPLLSDIFFSCYCDCFSSKSLWLNICNLNPSRTVKQPPKLGFRDFKGELKLQLPELLLFQGCSPLRSPHTLRLGVCFLTPSEHCVFTILTWECTTLFLSVGSKLLRVPVVQKLVAVLMLSLQILLPVEPTASSRKPRCLPSC